MALASLLLQALNGEVPLQVVIQNEALKALVLNVELVVVPILVVLKVRAHLVLVLLPLGSILKKNIKVDINIVGLNL